LSVLSSILVLLYVRQESGPTDAQILKVGDRVMRPRVTTLHEPGHLRYGKQDSGWQR